MDKLLNVKALDIYQHTFDKEKAYVMTQSKAQYYTSDKGKSWKKFETELEPTLKRSPLAFNSKKTGYILYTGMQCEEDQDWGTRKCIERVGFGSSYLGE